MGNITIIGKGEVGDKAKQLIAKTPDIVKIGFDTPDRTVLAEDFFDTFFQENKLGANLREVKSNQSIEAKIKKSSLSKSKFGILQTIQEKYKNHLAVAIRSSAAGDARGTGIYRSNFVDTEIIQMKKGLLDVLASYFTEDAIVFRKDAKTGEGMGIIVEPIIGQTIDQDERGTIFSPLISGYGYTSTPQGEGYINVVPLLGGGVDNKDGTKLKASILQEYNNNLEDYMEDSMSRRIYNPRITHGKLMDYRPNGIVYYKSSDGEPGSLTRSQVELRTKYRNQLGSIDRIDLFNKLTRIEQKYGYAQYFERAMTRERNKPKHWIVQINDVQKELEHLDFHISDKTVLIAKEVTGDGIKKCNKIVHCRNPGDENMLYEFNKHNKDYVVIFSSRLTTSARHGADRMLRYSDLSNAAVLLEICDAPHIGGSIGHFNGQIEATNKLFGVLDYHNPDFPLQRNRLNQYETTEYGLRVEEVKTTIKANSKKDMIIIDIEQ